MGVSTGKSKTTLRTNMSCNRDTALFKQRVKEERLVWDRSGF